MSENVVNGVCLCKKVSYEITGNMGIFQYCHCSRCRKFTGSAYAANLFVSPKDFRWLSGEDNVGTYDPGYTRYFTTAFCKTCGSSLPWLSKSGHVVIIPAGTLEGDPDIKPTHNLFSGSRPEWYMDAGSLPEHEEMPPRKV